MAHPQAQRTNPDGTPAACITQRSFGTYVAGEWLLTFRGSQTPTAGAVPLVWCHGLLDNGLSARSGPTFRMLQAFAAAGYVVLSADLGGFATWASPTAIGRIDTLLAWAVTNLAVRADTVVVAGQSMGSLLGLNWARRNRTRVGALWFRAPITHMDAVHDANPGSLGPSMETAYGGLAGFNAALPDHDPSARMAEFAGFREVMRLDATDADQYIAPALPAAFALATGAELRWSHGDHAANLYTSPADIVDWVDQRVRLPHDSYR